MFNASIPLLPPPSSSLLPPFHDRPFQDTISSNNAGTSLLHHQQQQQHRRNRPGHPHILQSRSQLSMLSFDERTIVQRKMAIAMYGYSWLKPAGCNKTMLGRREEEIEKEEVERQLREVEMQERNAMEAEEADRRSRLEEQARRERAGEDVGEDEGERDLDDDVPDMDVEGDMDDDEDDNEDEGVDLDADVPDADSNWRYDTTRDLDTESEEDDGQGDSSQLLQRQQIRGAAHIAGRGGVANQFLGSEDQDAAEQEALVNAMLDEDELGELEYQQRDLDDDLPDMDADISMAVDNDDDRDLDDDVPEADEDEGDGWEHTDTELDESDMDISILPTAHQHPDRSVNLAMNRNEMPPPMLSSSTDRRQVHGRRRGPTRYSNISEQSEPYSSMRRTSGNMLPPPPAFNLSRSQAQVDSQPRTGHRPQPPQPRRSPRMQMQTPSSANSDISVSALISTGNTTDLSGGAHRQNPGSSTVEQTTNTNSRSRSWLNPAGTRRNLFGSLRGAGPAIAGPGRGIANTSRNVSNIQNQAPGGMITNSSGGLFTPSPRIASGLGPQTGNAGVGRPFEAEDTPEPEQHPGADVELDVPPSRTRSGRVHGHELGRRIDRSRRQRGGWDDT